VDGLLDSSIIGFYTQLHCNNFIETADRSIECHIDREHATVSVGGHAALDEPSPQNEEATRILVRPGRPLVGLEPTRPRLVAGAAVLLPGRG